MRALCAAVPVCLLFSACDPVDGPPLPPRFSAPKPEARRAPVPSGEISRWIDAWRNLRDELTPLRDRLTGLQQFHTENHFESFLKLDPESLDTTQLCTLFHFLDRGYFVVERQIVIDLLKRRIERTSDPSGVIPDSQVTVKDRFAAAMRNDELRMVDMETAIEHYSKAGNADIQIPNSLSEGEREELLSSVKAMLKSTRAEIAEMDRKIEVLKSEVFHTPLPPEVPAVEAAEESDAVAADNAEAAPVPPLIIESSMTRPAGSSEAAGDGEPESELEESTDSGLFPEPGEDPESMEPEPP
jgi:hypothetical protein